MPGPFCPSCSYDLQAQITKWGARCPECGSGFTAEELERHARPRPWRPIAAVGTIIIAPPIVVVALLWFGLETWWEDSPGWYDALFYVVLGATPIAHQVFAMRCCDRHGWSYLFGSFIGVALTLTSAAAFIPCIVLAFLAFCIAHGC